MKRREAESKREKERYTHLDTEFQRIARRENKAFLSDQCKQNGKDQRSLQENQRYQGNISCKDGLNTGQNGMDLTEAEDIKKRWQKYTEELCKKDLHHPDNHDDVITHLEPDILECEVKWAL